MRRKLVNWETFNRIQKDSLSAAERELSEATDVLSRTLDVDLLNLNCFGESNVVYETVNGTYLRADYLLKDNYLTLENIEELVIDTESANKASKKKIADMVEAILSNETEKANQFFLEYMGLPTVRKNLSEGREGGFVRPSFEKKKAAEAKTKNAARNPSKYRARKRKLDTFGDPNSGPRLKRGTFGKTTDPNYMKKYYKNQVKGKTKRKVLDTTGKVHIKQNMKEWTKLSENVLGYCDFVEHGPTLQESQVRRDERGQVVAVRLPASHLRNEGKMLYLTYKHMLDTEVKYIRDAALSLPHNENFCKAVAELKRHNNLSDNEGLQKVLENIVGAFPGVLYLTQEELAGIIGEALQTVGVSNYDDQMCAFMSEGILRTAHDVLADKVEKIRKLARQPVTSEADDPYIEFQNIVTKFYPSLDENFKIESKVFTDLFDAVQEVHGFASYSGDEALKEDAEGYMKELSQVVSGETNADIELAAEVAEWLNYLSESNLDTTEWDPSNDVYHTISGDHPRMGEVARKSYSPAQDLNATADWQKETSEKAFTGYQWTGIGGKDIFPDLRNPYIPDPMGDYTMKGDRGADKDWEDGSGSWQSKDTYPNLQNPNIPSAVNASSYKMKNGSDTDLVVDL